MRGALLAASCSMPVDPDIWLRQSRFESRPLSHIFLG
jgi:hypothetical protein